MSEQKVGFQPISIKDYLIPDHAALTDHGIELGGKIKEAIRERLAVKEHFIARYLDATGSKIEDTILVEKQVDQYTTIYWCEPRKKS